MDYLVFGYLSSFCCPACKFLLEDFTACAILFYCSPGAPKCFLLLLPTWDVQFRDTVTQMNFKTQVQFPPLPLPLQPFLLRLSHLKGCSSGCNCSVVKLTISFLDCHSQEKINPHVISITKGHLCLIWKRLVPVLAEAAVSASWPQPVPGSDSQLSRPTC